MNQENKSEEKEPLVKDIKINEGASNKKLIGMVAIGVFVLFAGIYTGKVLAQAGSTTSKPSAQESLGTTDVAMEQVADEESAQGTLNKGGIEGEGTHHLVRDGQDNVYLISSIVDLEGFVGEEVKVWGKSVGAQSAGWLIDVIKIKEIN